MNAHSGRRAGRTLAAVVLLAGCTLMPHRTLGPNAAKIAAPAPVGPPATTVPPRLDAPRARPAVDVASWYGEAHQGRPTASGEPFDMLSLTAAHRAFPLGTCIEVLNLANGRHVFVRINDRGPYVPGRTLDLSQRAAEELGMVDAGLARVRVRRARAQACEAERRDG